MEGNFSPIYLKFHPFKLPPKHLHHLFSSNRKLKLGAGQHQSVTLTDTIYNRVKTTFTWICEFT